MRITRGTLRAMDGPRAAERRLVTCLFLDIVGSTEMLMSVAPERMKRTLDNAFAQVGEIVTTNGGTVEKYIGDAIFALFGAPVGHADDALRALRAAEAIMQRVAGGPVRVRVGIETGEALVDLAAAQHERQRMAVGPCVTIAARLQVAAEPGQVLVGPTCAQAAAASAEMEPLGSVALKGIGTLETFRLVRTTGEPPSRRARFVGREQELGRLRSALERARSGSATFVLVSAPPGQGKSRLVAEFVESAAEVQIVTARCRPGAESGSFTPLKQLLSEDGDVSREDVERRVATLFDDELERRRIGGALIHSAGLGTTDVLPTIPADRQDELVSAWRRYFAAIGRGAPTIVWIEDLHWAEPQFIRLLDRLTLAANAALLLICTARPEFGGLAALRPGADRVHLEVGELDDDAAHALAASVSDDGGQVVERAQGNPLFIVELARSRSRGTALPVSLQGAIEARLDELPTPDRELLQRAAVAGEGFGVRDAALLADRDTSEAAGALARLTHGAYLDAIDDGYRFHHALLHEVAYGRLPVADRMRLHARYASEGVHPEDSEALAYHWWEALRPPEAEWVWEDAPELPRMRREAFVAQVTAARRHAERFAHEQAVETYARASSLTSDPLDIAEVERAIGNAYARNAQGDDAWTHRLRAIDAYQAAGRPAPAAFYAETLAIHAYNWGFVRTHPPDDLLLGLWQDGMRIARELNEPGALARLLLQHGYYSNSPEDSERAAQLAEELPDPVADADLFQRIAMNQFVSGDVAAAERTYSRVEALVARGARVDEMEFLVYRSNALLLMADLSRAEELADQLMLATAAAGAHLRSHALQAKTILAVYRGDWPTAEAMASECVRVAGANPGTAWCLRGAYAVVAGAISAGLAGRREDAEAFIAAGEPMAAAGPARINTMLLPAALSGRPVEIPAEPAVLRPSHRQVIDALRLHEPIALAICGRLDELPPHIERLAQAGPRGARVAEAVASALREELAAAAGGAAPAHRDLHALGVHGLSQLISHRSA